MSENSISSPVVSPVANGSEVLARLSRERHLAQQCAPYGAVCLGFYALFGLVMLDARLWHLAGSVSAALSPLASLSCVVLPFISAATLLPAVSYLQRVGLRRYWIPVGGVVGSLMTLTASTVLLLFSDVPALNPFQASLFYLLLSLSALGIVTWWDAEEAESKS